MIHDENKDVKLLSKVAKINLGTKSIFLKHDQIIGNRRWGRIDFLCHYCGYHVVREDGVVSTIIIEPENKRKKDEVKKKKSNKKIYG